MAEDRRWTNKFYKRDRPTKKICGPNLIFWIAMGCGDARFGRKGQKTPKSKGGSRSTSSSSPASWAPWSQPTSDMCTVVREGAHKFWSFLGSFFGIMTKLMGSWAHSFNSWALLLGRHWTHGLICPKNCKNFKSWALSFLSIHEQKSNAPIWNILNIFSTAGALVVVTV